MKNIIAMLLATISLISSGMIYSQTYIVTDVNHEQDIVTIESCTGYTYEFIGTEDYMQGDIVSCIMYNNQTDNITDDVILNIRYSGTADMLCRRVE